MVKAYGEIAYPLGACLRCLVDRLGDYSPKQGSVDFSSYPPVIDADLGSRSSVHDQFGTATAAIGSQS